MARNEEKAKSMLNRWIKMKRMLHSKEIRHRPRLADRCNSISKCGRWRRQIIQEIIKKMNDIQNAGLGEHKIRQINDELNHLLQEKASWERRIKFLGGPDHIAEKAKEFISHGAQLPGSGGYFYFGAAKDLPGVRELFQKEKPQAPKKSFNELYKNINASYYGFGMTGKKTLQNEEEELLLSTERKYEEKMQKQTIKKWVLQNKDFLLKRMKDFGYKDPSQWTDNDIRKVMDEDIDQFQQKHQMEEVLYKNFKQSSKETQIQQIIKNKKLELLKKYDLEQEMDFNEDNEFEIPEDLPEA